MLLMHNENIFLHIYLRLLLIKLFIITALNCVHIGKQSKIPIRNLFITFYKRHCKIISKSQVSLLEVNNKLYNYYSCD